MDYVSLWDVPLILVVSCYEHAVTEGGCIKRDVRWGQSMRRQHTLI